VDLWKARLNNPGIVWYPDGMGETPALILGYVDVQYKLGIYTRDEQKIDRPRTHTERVRAPTYRQIFVFIHSLRIGA